ncbi:hypothetical protein PV325_012102 [Microctonus aethiopoides]|uniref:N-acetyltransferase domain-containing protein n=1 Tax=Microctonus aethiopoides TaxID=144406 RepID=A0AA39FM45_9HYME|nr:hypothetical protein PV325_012102 [Microctonus aethiopoides]KAK0088147.1 hypothetical protein PV326_004932 [Microctonus aethiopoides]KAK0172169.1 hypothetical protein PV328_005518 [Microctonus aethiopoides]
MADEEPQNTTISSDHKVELTNIYGRRYQFCLQDVVNGYITLETAGAVPGTSADSQIFVEIPDDGEGIFIEPASLEGLRRDDPIIEDIRNVSTPPSTPDSDEFEEVAPDSDSDSTESIAKSEEIHLENVNNNDNQSQSAGPSGVFPDAFGDDSDEEYSESLVNFLRDHLHIPPMISPLDFVHNNDLASLLPSPDPSSISSGRRSDINIDDLGSPIRLPALNQYVDEYANEEYDSDGPGSPLPASGSQTMSSDDATKKRNPDDPDSPIRSPGARKYSDEGAIPKYKFNDSGNLIRPSGSRDFDLEEDNYERNAEDPDDPISASSSGQFPTGDSKRKHSSDESDSPIPPSGSNVSPRIMNGKVQTGEGLTSPNHASTSKGSPAKIRKTQYVNPVNLPVDYSMPSTSGLQSSSSHVSAPERRNESSNATNRFYHSSNLPIVRLRHVVCPRNLNMPPSFRNSNSVWTDIVLVRDGREFRFTFRLLDTYGRHQILSFMSVYYDDRRSMMPSCIETNGIASMRIIWDLALSENLSVGVFLDENPNEDLTLVGADVLLLMRMKSNGEEDPKKLRSNLFGFLCIDPQYRGFGLGKMLMEIRSQTERDYNVLSPDSGPGDNPVVDDCLYDAESTECLYEEEEDEEEEKEVEEVEEKEKKDEEKKEEEK